LGSSLLLPPTTSTWGSSSDSDEESSAQEPPALSCPPTRDSVDASPVSPADHLEAFMALLVQRREKTTQFRKRMKQL